MFTNDNSYNKMFDFDKDKNAKSMDYLNPIVTLAEFSKELNFKSELLSEFSIMNLLDYCGFFPSNKGYKYIQSILSVCVSQMYVPTTVKGLLEIAARHFGVRINNIEYSISLAIKDAIKRDKLKNLNKIFGCDYVGKHMTNGEFLNFVASRLILLKKYGEVVYYAV